MPRDDLSDALGGVNMLAVNSLRHSTEPAPRLHPLTREEQFT